MSEDQWNDQPTCDPGRRNAALLANARDIVAVLDGNGRIEYLNAAAERILGYEVEAMVGESASDYVAPADREPVAEAFERVRTASSPTAATVEHRCPTADGDEVWLESRLTNRVEQGVDGYVVSARDVTDRKRAERRRAVTEARLGEIAANAGDVLWMFSADWSELLFVNQAYEAVWGRSADALRADPADFLNGVAPEDRDRVRDAMDRLSAGREVDLEYRVNPAEDYGRWVWVHGIPVIEDGEVVRVAGFARDVTERRERERQLQAMERMLRHNLRNELNLILGHAASAIESVPSDSPAVDHLDRAVEHGERLLATADKGRQLVSLLGPDEECHEVNLGTVLESVVVACRQDHPDATVAVTLPDGVDEAALRVDAVPALPLAVRELVDNALRHSDAGALAEVGLVVEDDELAVVVVDEGPPIPDDDLAVLRGEHEAEPVRHGSGLGLWLVAWVARCSGGEVRFDRTEGGNVVRLGLPRCEDC